MMIFTFSIFVLLVLGNNCTVHIYQDTIFGADEVVGALYKASLQECIDACSDMCVKTKSCAYFNYQNDSTPGPQCTLIASMNSADHYPDVIAGSLVDFKYLPFKSV